MHVRLGETWSRTPRSLQGAGVVDVCFFANTTLEPCNVIRSEQKDLEVLGHDENCPGEPGERQDHTSFIEDGRPTFIGCAGHSGCGERKGIQNLVAPSPLATDVQCKVYCILFWVMFPESLLLEVIMT